MPRVAGTVDDRRVHVGILTTGRRGERAVGPIGFLAGDLCCAEDGGLLWPVDNYGSRIEWETSRRATDTPRVKQLEVAVRRNERAAVLEKEWPLLWKKRLEDR